MPPTRFCAHATFFWRGDDYGAAVARFAWPQLDKFNWALDWVDVYARGTSAPRCGLPTIL